MKILVACEYSGIVRDAFTQRGHDAMSCDILPTESKGNHYQGDVRDVLYDQWDMVIAFPPCTHLAVSGAMHFEKKRADGRQQEGIDFFKLFTNLECEKVCIENPIGIMATEWREPDQTVHPYYFGDEAQKATCLWLKGLPLLQHFPEDDLFNKKTWVGKGEFVEVKNKKTGEVKRQPKWYADSFLNDKATAGKERSKTFPGIANAMAQQWG